LPGALTKCITRRNKSGSDPRPFFRHRFEFRFLRERKDGWRLRLGKILIHLKYADFFYALKKMIFEDGKPVTRILLAESIQCI
jgi:hypothetical protein